MRMRITGDTSEMTARRPGDGPARRSAARVLIAEDERDVAELIRYTLAREGFEVIVATNGADALRQAPGEPARPDAAGPHAARRSTAGSSAGGSSRTPPPAPSR